jgi:hypothetical protein
MLQLKQVGRDPMILALLHIELEPVVQDAAQPEA